MLPLELIPYSFGGESVNEKAIVAFPLSTEMLFGRSRSLWLFVSGFDGKAISGWIAFVVVSLTRDAVEWIVKSKKEQKIHKNIYLMCYWQGRLWIELWTAKIVQLRQWIIFKCDFRNFCLWIKKIHNLATKKSLPAFVSNEKKLFAYFSLRNSPARKECSKWKQIRKSLQKTPSSDLSTGLFGE